MLGSANFNCRKSRTGPPPHELLGSAHESRPAESAPRGDFGHGLALSTRSEKQRSGFSGVYGLATFILCRHLFLETNRISIFPRRDIRSIETRVKVAFARIKGPSTFTVQRSSGGASFRSRCRNYRTQMGGIPDIKILSFLPGSQSCS
jgi:hypothetical protein